MKTEEFVTLVFLIMLSLQDIRNCKLKMKWLVVFIMAGVVAGAFRNGMDIYAWICDILPGICLLGVGRVSREAVGYGDGFTILAAGLVLGCISTVPLFLSALCLAVIWGSMQMIRGKGGWKSRFPFIPFLLAAEILIIMGRT